MEEDIKLSLEQNENFEEENVFAVPGPLFHVSPEKSKEFLSYRTDKKILEENERTLKKIRIKIK